MNYIKSFDSLRAIAVTLVIISHWLPQNHFLNFLPNGDIGVDAFFVLSGFLITTILLDNRGSELNDLKHKLILAKNFFARRSLRIFPIYFLLLIILYICQSYTHISLKHSILYHITYTSNIFFFIKQDWEGSMSHLWSLAVEEQFYLIWPWIILFTPIRYLKHVIIGFICLGICSNLVLYYIFPGKVLYYILTPTCFDAFGLGAIISHNLKYEPQRYPQIRKYVVIGILLSFLSVCILKILNPEIYLLRPLISFTCAYLILILLQEKSLINDLISNKILTFIGKISYGMYLFHNFIPWFFDNFLLFISKSADIKAILIQYQINNHNGLTPFILKYFILIMISYMSWRIIEKPLLSFKRFFS